MVMDIKEEKKYYEIKYKYMYKLNIPINYSKILSKNKSEPINIPTSRKIQEGRKNKPRNFKEYLELNNNKM